MTIVQLHGLPRSGTNFLKKVLETNFYVRVDAKLKHFPARYGVGQLVFVSKHPVDWVLSLFEFELTCNLTDSHTDWDKYLEAGIVTQFGLKNAWFANPVQIWNAYLHHYVNHRDMIHAQWEQLCNPDTRDGYLEGLGRQLHLPRKRDTFEFHVDRLDPQGVSTGEVFKPRERSTRYTQRQIDWVWSQVNKDLAARLRYHTRG